MILQCEQCNTKFRLDNAKIKEGGVKVRCSKCKHVFAVQKEAPQEETDFDSILDGLGSAAPAPATASAAAEAEERTPVQPADFEEQQKPEIFAEYGETTISTTEGAFAQAATDAEAELKSAEEEGFNFDDFAFSEEPIPEPPAAAATQKPLDGESGFDMDFFAFDKEEIEKKEEEPEAESKEDFSCDGFTLEEESSEAVPPDAESVLTSSDSDAFSFPEDEVISGTEESKAGEAEPIDFGGFDFDEVAIGGTPAEGKRSMEPVVEAPSVQVAQPKEAPSFAPAAEIAAMEDELPPLSIASRRKGNSIFSVAVIAVSVLVLLVLAGAGFFFLKDGAEALNKLGLASVAKWFGMQAAEEGSITIKNPVGSFVVNKEGGELFVINGEAVNSFKKPRATIHVKALLFGKNGAVLAQKSAYCGNQLSKEQLATMPMAKIEATMNNQFGDSLSNLGVQPGKSIPFVLVFANVPKDVVEFSVEVAGSTVASQ